MKRLVWLLFALLPSAPLWAADLLQIYNEARINDATYAAAQATLEAGRERMPQARAGLLPTLSLSANSLWNNNDLSLPTAAERTTSSTTATATRSR